MSLVPFTAPKNYAEMVNKIAVATFLVALAATWFIRVNMPAVDQVLALADLKVKIADTEVAFGYVLPAFMVALVARIIKLHDRVSDWFGIRRTFDTDEILVPLASGVGINVDSEMRKRLEAKRDDLMWPCFYRYATSTKPVIDEHLVTMALDQWHWYWIIVEADVVLIVTALVLLMGGHLVAAVPIALILIFSPLLMWSRGKSAEYAFREVRTILEEPARQQAVRQELDAV